MDPDQHDVPPRDGPAHEARRRIAELAASGETWLDLQGLGLTTLPEELFDLCRLEDLDLTGNELRELPEAIGRLTALTGLYLDGNKLRSLPEAIGELSALTDLDLEGNELTVLPEPVGRLTGLAGLNVAGNPLTALPPWIGRLTRLTSLDATECGLTCLPAEIGGLTSLDELELDRNALTSLPAEIGGLTALTTLYLSDNCLTELPDEIGQLAMLDTLSLVGNRLTHLPDSLARIPALQRLALTRNPSLWSPPPEALDQGHFDVVQFLRMCDSDPVDRWQSRVLVVGDAAAGKTSLIRRLRGKDFRPEEYRTRGFRVCRLVVRPPRRPDVSMALDMWDLGGLPEYRAAHLSHLNEDCLILLVWDARAGFADGGVAAWLETLSARVPEAPILIVATHGEEDPGAEPPGDLAARYPRIVGTCVVDSRSDLGIPELREAVACHAADLPLTDVRWPRPWADAVQRVLDLPGPTVTPAEIRAAIAVGDGVTKPPYSAVVRMLLARGQISRVEARPESVAGFAVLPGQLQKRIAEVVDSPVVRAAGGVLSRAELDRLWRDLPEKGVRLRSRTLRLMEDFGLAYRIGDPNHSADVAVVVDALPESRPPDVDRQWRELAARPGMREVGAVYRLASREVDVVRRFIAREHRFTTGIRWRYGALLHDRDPDMPAWALIEQDGLEHPTVTLRVVGTCPALLRSLLVEAFDALVDERCAGFVSGPEPLHPGTEDGAAPGVEDPIDAARLAALDGIRMMAEHRSGFAKPCPALFGIRPRRFFRRSRMEYYVLHLWCEWPSGPHPLPPGVGDFSVGSLSEIRLPRYTPYLRHLIRTLRLTEYGPGRSSAISLVKLIDRRWGTPDSEPTDDPRPVPAGDFETLKSLFWKIGAGPVDSWDGLTAVCRPEDHRLVYLCAEHVADFEYPYGSGGVAS